MFDFLINVIKKDLEIINKSSSSLSNNRKINYVNYIGSPFKWDIINVSYLTEMIVNIENSVSEGKVIILSNLVQYFMIYLIKTILLNIIRNIVEYHMELIYKN